MRIQINTPKELLKVSFLFPKGYIKVIGKKSFWVFFSLEK